jgi:hypothetical protein
MNTLKQKRKQRRMGIWRKEDRDAVRAADAQDERGVPNYTFSKDGHTRLLNAN